VKRIAPLIAVFLISGCSHADRLATVHFRPGHGWHVGSQREEAWAMSGGRRARTGLPGLNYGVTIRPKGIAISLNLGRPSRVNYDYGMSWPPRVTRGHLQNGLEGLPRMSNFQWYGRIRQWGGALIVIFGSPPTNAQLARANAELRSAQLP